MLWKRRDMGSDPVHPTFVTTDIPTVDDDQFVEVRIPIAAYKRLVDWCSMGRTMDNIGSCLENASPDPDRRRSARDELEMLEKALNSIHAAIRGHYTSLPVKVIEKPKG